MECIKGITRQIENHCSYEVVIVQIKPRIITEPRAGGVNQSAYKQITRSINRALKMDLKNHFLSFGSSFIIDIWQEMMHSEIRHVGVCVMYIGIR